MSVMLPSVTMAFLGMILGFAELSAGEAARGPKPVVVTETDAGKTVQVANGAGLEARLASNPTTGYRWRATQAGGQCLRQMGEGEYQGPGVRMPGAGGTETFRFQAVRSGKCRLVFQYQRSWEPKPIKEIVINVVVAR